MKRLMLFCCLSAGCLVTQGVAATLNVPGDYPSIQSAIIAAADEDVIVVAEGTYTEQNIYLYGKAITVQSANPLDPAATVIDCGGLLCSGFIFESGETASTIIDGFTIIHSSWGLGGALVCMFGSSPTIRNCIITNNNADSDGAGLYSDIDCSPTIENCTFNINTSGLSGGAVSIAYGNPIFSNCRFVQNSSGFWGGAISINYGNPTFMNCLIMENSSAYWGGAVYAYGGSPVFRNCVIAGNYADKGGAFYFDSTDHPQIVNCTVIDNLAGSTEDGSGVSGIYSDSSMNLTIENSLFWGNAVAIEASNTDTIYITGQIEGSNTRIAYCDIEDYANTLSYDGDYTTVEGLIDANPRFELDGSFSLDGKYIPGDWHLQKNSLCINAGDPAFTPLDGETDIDGEARVMNGRIDIGADEIEAAIAARINIVPGKLVVPCKGFVLAMIRLPEGYSVKHIHAKTVLWAGTVPALWVEKCRYSAVAVFDLNKVSQLLDDAEGTVEVTITGQLADGTAFIGNDTIQVKQVYWKHWFQWWCHSACKK
ncbi:MAG: right-handed parallel beta-helix repeat-containing protein [Phycisphaerae bacterium]|nr:right-handed parallel beta-helix repeat-containing protein [Phycisphaerae bacterium]